MHARFLISGYIMAVWVLAMVTLTLSSPVSGQVKPNAGMMRFPDVSADKIVFVYGEDIWIAPRTGGLAAPLAAPVGEEALPRFSPDGKTVAFVGNYEGNEDIYTIPTEGGAAKRITYHPSAELLCDWTADGRLLYSSDAYVGLGRQSQLFVRGIDEPLPHRLAIPYGTNGAIDAEGTWLAYTPHSHDYRTWKRYRGGMASDIWLFNLKTNEAKQITDFEGTDSLPMWFGNTVYYVTDAGPEHRLNIWSLNTKNGERQQLTKFTADDCKFPSIGPGPDGKGEIIVQNGAGLHLISLMDGKVTPVQITVPGDRPKIRPRNVDASDWIESIALSPNAKRITVEARGDVWTVPAKNGSPRNLTRTSGIAEREPRWSPDGKSIAYFSDATGEYEMYVRPSDGNGEPQMLTKDGKGYRYQPTWSPDSKWLYHCDKTGAMWMYSFDNKESKQFDRDPSAAPTTVQWSHNSEWLVYARNEDERIPRSSLWVYNVVNGTKRKLTSGFFNDANPTFDRKGEFVYFSSSRAFNAPKYEDVGTTFVYSGTEVLMAMPLRTEVKLPLQPESDEEPPADKQDSNSSKDNEGDKKEGDSKEKPKEEPFKPFAIDADGIESRSFQIPVKQGNFGRVLVNEKGHLIYARVTSRDEEDQATAGSIQLFDFASKDRKEQAVVDGKTEFSLTPDGKKLLVVENPKKLWIVDPAPAQKLENAVPMTGLNTMIDPRSEWKQVLREAWRIERDFFYDPNMHGINWQATYEHYSSMLDDCVSRRDVSFLIREMIAELNVGHAYYSEGDVEKSPKVSTGLLGCRFELAEGAFRIAEIYQGSAWDYDARNSLVVNGIKPGDFLLAVNGLPLDNKVDPYSAFQRLADSTVTLTFSSDAKLDDADRKVVVKLLGNDSNLRFRHWIEAKRKYIAEKSDGRIGYIYVVNTGVPGQNDLVRQFYGQINKDALIIDERWNGGGQIPTRFIELLNRPATNYWAVRDGRDWAWSPDSHQGPKCMLINGMAGSGGDMFPSLFKHNKLGKLIGTRTWGGLVGISGNPSMIDGSSVTAPTFAYYELDGTWGIEGHGVDPDIKVVDDPSKMMNGGDPQLDEAIRLMLEEIKTNGFKPPQRPAYPDRKGFGIKPEDK
jgi:tricorn protease